MSEELEVYKNSKKSEQETNELFQHFINNYTIVYEWNATKTMNDEVKGQTICALYSYSNFYFRLY